MKDRDGECVYVVKLPRRVPRTDDPSVDSGRFITETNSCFTQDELLTTEACSG